MHDLSREELPSALSAWAYLVGSSEPLAEALTESLGWLRARWDAGDDHLPLTLVHDLGLLLLRGRDFRFASTRDLARWPESEREARLCYEDRVLGRWALDPSVLDAHVAVSGMAPALRHAAVSHAVGLALSRPLLDCESMVCGNPAHLRAVQSDVPAKIPASFGAWAQGALEEPWRAWGFAQLAEAMKCLPTLRLFRPEDLWEIAHLPELPSESARLELRELNGAVSRIGPVPPSVALSVRHTAREVPVEAEESDHYPAGGFDAISTRGSFENLMRSEVSYVGEGAETPGGIDLFDVRFVEGELLFYTRDESPLLDARRDVTVVFDQPDEQRHKQPALPSQTLVLSEAAGLALQGDLLRVFGPSGSRVRFVWRTLSPEDRVAAEEEQKLMGLLLKAEIAHRRVELSTVEAWSDVSELGRVVFSPRAYDSSVPCAAWVRVGEQVWTVDQTSYDLSEGHGAIRALCDRLLVSVAKRHTARAKKPIPRSKLSGR